MQRNEDEVERTIGVLLRTGVLTAAFIVLAGGIWYLAQFGLLVPDYRTFHGEPADLRTVGGVWRGMLALQPRCLIQFGLLLLIATPISRVAFSVVAFAMQRDKTYVALSVVVLAVLLWSLTGTA